MGAGQMALHLSTSLPFRRKAARRFAPSCSSLSKGSLAPKVERLGSANAIQLNFEESRKRIKKFFDDVEISVSSYDTAWVAMVPSPHSSQKPCFPECLEWLLENQLQDGSWALPHQHASLIKDILSSTLACVLALKRWNLGEEQIKKGTNFIESNFALAIDESQISPIGFEIIFPGMLEHAKELNLDLNLEPTTLCTLLHERDLELDRCDDSQIGEREAYLAYISEGVGKLQDWKSVMKYQRKNGSLFNSPSATAAVLTQIHDTRCLSYLNSVLKKFQNAVPTVYPLEMYAQLFMVDNLERLGISRHFRKEIKRVLDEAYRCWLQEEEEIFAEASTCALAFRLLRMNRYPLSSDPLTRIFEGNGLMSYFGGHLEEINVVLESYKASQVILYPKESTLEMHNLRFKIFLEQQLSHSLALPNEYARLIQQEVNYALNYPFYANLERIASRRNIEHFKVANVRILKSSYCSPNFSDECFLSLASKDFNKCQATHREELKELERWFVEHRLDQLHFLRQKAAYCYFSGAATIFSPDLSATRMAWAKCCVLATLADDFYDFSVPLEELNNLIQLIKKWDVNVKIDCCSENVQTVFSAVHDTICDIGEKASMLQGRNVTQYIIDCMLITLNSMLKEAEWARNMIVPTVDEYMENAFVSFALGTIVLPTLLLLGPKLSDDVLQHLEYHTLFKLMSTCGRLLNDCMTFERELKHGKQNAVLLYKMKLGGDVSDEVAIQDLKSLVADRRRELLKLVLQEENSVVPRACKDLFWKMCQITHYFYKKDDGFTLEDMTKDVKKVIYKPIVLDNL